MTTVSSSREQVVALMRAGQSVLINGFAEVEAEGAALAGLPAASFATSTWERPGGGGGTARVLTEGVVFERAGVNVSAVYGDAVPPSLYHDRPHLKGAPYFATGVSMVLHPRNPYVPAFHANYRYFEAGNDCWFGGGMDMTPAYGFDEDAVHFHSAIKTYVDRHDVADYQTLKETCDRYFFIKHRNEMRGIGGIFFDMLDPQGDDGFDRGLAFAQDGIETILAAYLPVVRRRMASPYGEREREWQLYRRGRYVEFNLVYDKGTVFGLQTNGNIEAILMSMPPLARWEFQVTPEPGSPEADVARFLQPHAWAV
ncbi:oxygen-dependent coproporphyrinogen oxidase [Oscillochloris sp. ZM17-4]|uniref:oxygen-dependent coproporphyrinogen oxidase n=1 Tax=Oscillochloris sp. ZM17-4 TaxID=2866714 RepID=UPI001C72D8B6|nr:oxygen-dependent coproporphyrinogen oxidase [Oscillochloris sp. ZM17-4]MBX0326380.1 oxygen-dependent coproporphyrinogen oxidase [Oscillochloris sp. ZM17-4]